MFVVLSKVGLFVVKCERHELDKSVGEGFSFGQASLQRIEAEQMSELSKDRWVKSVVVQAGSGFENAGVGPEVRNDGGTSDEATEGEEEDGQELTVNEAQFC